MRTVLGVTGLLLVAAVGACDGEERTADPAASAEVDPVGEASPSDRPDQHGGADPGSGDHPDRTPASQDGRPDDVLTRGEAGDPPPEAGRSSTLTLEPWRLYYDASGAVSGRRGTTSRTYEAPPEMHVIWDPPRRSLRLGGLSEEAWDREAPARDRYSLGLRLGLGDIERGDVAEFSVTAPIDGGSSTIAFAPEGQPLPFLRLAVGEEHADVTNDQRYVLSTSRPAASVWRIELALNPEGPEPFDGFHTGVFAFRTDDIVPPWNRLELEFEGTNAYGTASGRLVMTLDEGHQRNTPPPAGE